MSTRSRTRSTSKQVSVPGSAVKPRSKQVQLQKADEATDQDQTGKENKQLVGARAKGKGPTPLKVTRAAKRKQYCLCKQPDDGTPMVNCSECKDWYVLFCITVVLTRLTLSL